MKSSEKRIKTLPIIITLSVIAVAVVTIFLLQFLNGSDTSGSSDYIMPAKPRFIYTKNKVLYMYDDGTSERMSEDICRFFYIKNAYGTDEEEPANVLTINTDGKETAIKDEVNRYCVLDKDNIMMICGIDYEADFRGGTLYLYKDGKTVKVDEEVTSIETAVKRYDKIDLDYYSMQ